MGGMTVWVGSRFPGAVVTVDLEPGHYVFFCLVEDQKDARPHLMYGMVREVQIT